MSAPDDTALQPQPAPGVVPVTIRSTVPAMQDGTLILARIDAPSIGVDCAYLFLDPKANALGLLAGCGCTVHVPLAGLINSLAENMHGAHAASGHAPQARH